MQSRVFFRRCISACLLLLVLTRDCVVCVAEDEKSVESCSEATNTMAEAAEAGSSSVPLLRDVSVALVTPFKDDDSGVNVDAVAPLVEMHLAAGTHGFYLCGSTGEGAAMTVAERKVMVEATVAAVAGRAPVVVMVGNCPVQDAIELAKHAAEHGADAVSTTVPRDKPGDLDAAVEFFTAVGGASSLPLYIYWIASTAAEKMTAPVGGWVGWLTCLATCADC